MADAPAETTSTPAPAAPPAGTVAPTATPPVPASIESPPAPAQPTKAATDSTPAPTATQDATAAPTTTEPTATTPAAPAFKLPDDLKLAPEAVEKFQGFVTGKSPGVDGKFSLTAQELVDVFADQARDAQARWHAQLAVQDKTWEAESKARFTGPQLAAAESAIGFLTSYEPAFRELAQSYRNHPSFVNAMRVIGERLSEDTFEIQGAPPAPAKPRPEDVFWRKPN